MSSKDKKTTNEPQTNKKSQNEELIKSKINENLYDNKPVYENYQPTDELDTSNPPTNSDDNQTE